MFEGMCPAFRKSRTESRNLNKHQVLVNVYDMLEPSVLTTVGYVLGVGIYHSGVEICGKEYCFGGHDYENLTGVFNVVPKVGPPGVQFKQSIPMGYADLSEDEIQQIIQSLSDEFVGTSYNLLTRNCNHFSEEFCKRLTGKSIPGWINRAAKLGTMFPCVIPDEWIEPPEFETETSKAAQSPTSLDSNQPESPAMSYSSRSPLKHTTARTPKHHSTQTTHQTVTRINTTNSPQVSQSSPTSRHSAEVRYSFHQAQAFRRGSGPSSPASRRPSGSVAEDRESVLFMRSASPLADDELFVDNPVKEPDSCRPEIMRSATQLSITASLQEIERSHANNP